MLETGFDINSDEATRQIAQMWGLTRPEAVHVKKYPSYMAIPINYANDKIAVFYMDSTDEDAFPLEEEQEFCGFINKTFRKNGLLSAISQLDARLSVPNKIDPLEVIENG